MTNREQMIRLAYEILMEGIGKICIHGEYSSYELALETLRDIALETIATPNTFYGVKTMLLNEEGDKNND